MHPRVTAIVVARNGGDHLARTLDALRAQTRAPDAVIAIDCASSDDTGSILAEFGATKLLASSEELSFGDAVATAVRVTEPSTSDDEWLWLLAQDTAPEPTALERLLGVVEVSPSVAVAGPKQTDWDDASYLRELGQSLTPLGSSVPVVEDELDQAQHDGLSDVLGVGPAGMLVRHTLWDRLGGFDPALPVVDDALDFCVRTRLAGHRVCVVPSARVATAGDGIAGPVRSTKSSHLRRLFRLRRAAQLHRRMVYAPPAAVPIHWLCLVPLAILRSLWRLLAKQPGAVPGEFAAAFRTAFSGMRVGTARRSLARTKTASWSSIAPLRIPQREVRRRRALKRDSALIRSRGERAELNFFSGSGIWTVVGAAILSVAVFVPLLGTSVITGGGLLPLNGDVGSLWGNLGYGWRDIGLGFVGAADPFSAVLAVLGSLTFWQPSYSMVLLFLAAMPLAALGAWLCATRITGNGALRAFAAVVWTLAPPFLTALADGRPAAVLFHILVPWLFFAGLAAARSWAAAATTALLLAAALACAPSAIPALLIVWIAATIAARRNAARLVAIPLPALVLFAPLVWQQIARGTWLGIFADPGTVGPLRGATGEVPGTQLTLAMPDGGFGGWPAILTAFGLPGTTPQLIVPILFAPLAILALLALFLRGFTRAIPMLAIALLGFATAVAAAHVMIQSLGAQPVSIWPGSGLSLYWLGITASAVVALGAIGRFAVAPGIVCVVFVALAAAPLTLAMPFGTSRVAATDGTHMPAVVTAEASIHPRVGTLRITPQPNGGIGAELIRGAGPTLDTQSTLASTRRELDAGQRQLADLAANLASRSGKDVSGTLKKLGIGFVQLAPPQLTVDGRTTSQAQATRVRAVTALDGNPVLAPVGHSATNLLWSFHSGRTATPEAAMIPPGAGGGWRVLVLVVQAVVIGLALLLSIPTGRVVAEPVPVARDEEPEPDAGEDDEPDADEPDADEPDADKPDADKPASEAAADDSGEASEPSAPDSAETSKRESTEDRQQTETGDDAGDRERPATEREVDHAG